MKVTKKVEKPLRNLGNVCYDNRILVMKFLPFTDYVTFSNGLVHNYGDGKKVLKPKAFYYYPRGSNSSVLIGVYGDLTRNVFERFLIKFLYGYFHKDPMRKIYCLEWRMRISIHFNINNTKYAIIKAKEVLFHGSRVLELNLLGDSLKTLEIDFTGIPALSNFTFQSHVSQENVINVLRNSRYRLDILFLKKESETQKISMEGLSGLISMSKSAYFQNYEVINGYDTILSNSGSNSRCTMLSFSLMKLHFFSQRHFQSFGNLRSFLGRDLTFRTPSDFLQFFKNLRKYSPRLRFLSLHILDIEDSKRQTPQPRHYYETNLLTILCRNNLHLQELIIEYGLFFCDDLESLNFENDTLYHLMFRNFRTSEQREEQHQYEPKKYEFSIFQRIFRCFPSLGSFGFRNVSSDQEVISELPEILKIVPKIVKSVHISFFNLKCSEILFSSFVHLNETNRLKGLSFSFSNTLDFLDRGLIFCPSFGNLENLKLLAPVHIEEKTVVERIGFTVTRKILVDFCNHMKNLKTFEFGPRLGSEPMIYFLRYSEKTGHLRNIMHHFHAKNFPKNPYSITEQRVFYSDDDNDDVNAKPLVRPSDSIFNNMVFRDVEYFEKYCSEDIKLLRSRNLERRRRIQLKKVLVSRSEEAIPEECNLPISKIVFSKFIDDPKNVFQKRRKEEMKNSFRSWFGGSLFSSLVYVKSEFLLSNNNTDAGNFQARMDIISNHFRGWYSICVSEFTLFSKEVTEEGDVCQYDFISPSGLDFLRYCVSFSRLSRENFIRLICSMVGIELTADKGGRIAGENMSFEGTDFTPGDVDMTWVFREAQRIYGVRFEELKDDDVDFVDCMFDKKSSQSVVQ